MVQPKPSRGLPRFWTEVRDSSVQPDWGLTVVVLAALGIGVAIATGLGDPSRTLYTVFPALIGVAVGLADGPRAATAAAVVTAVLVVLATLAAVTPLTATLAFFAVLLWLTIPGRFAPPNALASLLQLAYFVVAAFGSEGTTWLEALLYAGAGVLGGVVLLAAITVSRRRSAAESPPCSPGNDEASPPEVSASSHGGEADTGDSRIRLLGHVLAAGVSAGLMYWRLTGDSQDAAWILLTFMLVLQPTSLATAARSIGRVGGTIVGFILVVLISLLPGNLSTAVGLAALAPSVAYSKRDYVVSVAATTIVVVTVYAAPTGAYVAWGLTRLADTAVGAVLAILVSALARRAGRMAAR